MNPRDWLLALALGFCLDLLLGDPYWMPHPIRWIGNLIANLEKPLRALFPKSPKGELAAGTALVIAVVGLSGGLCCLVLWLCGLLSPWLSFGVQVVLSYQLLATKSLKDESNKVYTALTTGTLDDARYAVSMIVGRDTANLDASGITKATVETVAENASDGVVAPLLFLALGGAPLGMAYKAVNTMDSMVGYKNDRFLYFGRCAAKLDDVLNFIPARLAGVLMCMGAWLAGFNGKKAFQIFIRDRKNHKSPNSAHTEAACAGALEIQLAGSNYYFGKLVVKPTIGDDIRPIAPADIGNSHRLLYATAVLTWAIVCLAPLALVW
ncbi:adenosylcobinamide-phosphate synthase CbiB [Bengtsoniella intestinalis]|uniref:adenosylcobinamide-phosphate synthase CbiB n=1 Tax=Bengtsoniella intestinalis TaxID=3073143 RepID=UPI00391F0CDC